MGICFDCITRCAAQGLPRDPLAGHQAGEGNPPYLRRACPPEWGGTLGAANSFPASLWLGSGTGRVARLCRPPHSRRGSGAFASGPELADSLACAPSHAAAAQQDLAGCAGPPGRLKSARRGGCSQVSGLWPRGFEKGLLARTTGTGSGMAMGTGGCSAPTCILITHSERLGGEGRVSDP